MEEGDSLGAIFKERLFTRERKQAQEPDKENMVPDALAGPRIYGGAAAPSKAAAEEAVGRVLPLTQLSLNTTGDKARRRAHPAIGTEVSPAPQESAAESIPAKTRLDGIYQSEDLANVYRTRELLVKAAPIDYNNVDGLSIALSGKEEVPQPVDDTEAEKGDSRFAVYNAAFPEHADGRDGVRSIEAEFERFKMAQIESLRLKSKVYRFIHAEIYKMDRKYAERIRALEEENKRLATAVAQAEEKHKRYCESMEASISKFKDKVAAAVREYKKKHRGADGV
ncbi:hypothetical protein PAPHI01_2367 [Pancytospora philotis]|nr:hypothetical protein PAPHI01_2367 [Pancytospora philotis]